MHTTMRSQDLWLGFCYDIFTTTILQELLAGWLGAGLGSYRLSIDSLHLYDHDILSANRVPANPIPGPQMTPLATPWETLDDVLAAVIAGTPLREPGLAELSCVLASYRSRKAGDLEAADAVAASHDGPVASALRRWYQRADASRQTRQPAGEASR
jgi:thymidylate synthase